MAGKLLTAEEREIIINALIEDGHVEEDTRETFEDLKDTKLMAFAEAVLNSDSDEEELEDAIDDELEDEVEDIDDELEDGDDDDDDLVDDDDDDDSDEEDELDDAELELATNKKKIPPQFLKFIKKKGGKSAGKGKDCEEPATNEQNEDEHTCNKCGGKKGKKDSTVEDEMTGNMSTEDWINTVPPEIAEIVNNAMKVTQDEKAKLIQSLTANLSGEPQKKMIRKLATNSLEELKDLLTLIPKPQVSHHNPVVGLRREVSYAGAATPGQTTTTNSKKESAPLIPPTINWAEAAAEFAGRN